ncbi:MAG: carbamate kinase [Erysipelotrichia bacterium]|jgi:carbamate kinase|nr:carbamate kinase [Erysipelotrichia bacterium]
MSKYVISLGGNALGNNPIEQKELLKEVAKPIVELIKQGHQVVLVHGNGPQVGMINLAFTESSSTPEMPFPECGAMSQGYIGYHLQNAISNEFLKQKIDYQVATIITQVVVDENDPLFQNPTKPIGTFYTQKEALKIEKGKGYIMKEDSGRGYRRVVPSPLPVDVVESEIIKTLLNEKHLVICAGGGGIPVIKKENKLQGIAAVIDKDYASSKVAKIIDADYLVILTAVEHVYINYLKENETKLTTITSGQMRTYLDKGFFAKGSMLPKVEACLLFVEKTINKTAIITSLQSAKNAFLLKTGTIIKS